MNSYGEEKIQCATCAFNIKRTDMKNVKYCVKNNFPIYDDTKGCIKYVGKKHSK